MIGDEIPEKRWLQRKRADLGDSVMKTLEMAVVVSNQVIEDLDPRAKEGEALVGVVTVVDLILSAVQEAVSIISTEKIVVAAAAVLSSEETGLKGAASNVEKAGVVDSIVTSHVVLTMVAEEVVSKAEVKTAIHMHRDVNTGVEVEIMSDRITLPQLRNRNKMHRKSGPSCYSNLELRSLHRRHLRQLHLFSVGQGLSTQLKKNLKLKPN